MNGNGNGAKTGTGRVEVQIPTDGSVAWLRLPFESRGAQVVNSTDMRLQLQNEKDKKYFADPGKGGGSLPDGQSWRVSLLGAATNEGQCSVTFTEEDPGSSDWAGGFAEAGGSGTGASFYRSGRVTLIGGTQLIVAARSSRQSVRLTNRDAANGAYFFGAGQNAAAGEILDAGASVVIGTKDAIYGDVVAGTPIIAFGETFD